MMQQAEDLYPSRRLAHPEWMDRRDPVVHARPEVASPLVEEQVAGFERDGFLALANLFSPAEISAMQAELARLRAAPDAVKPETLIAEPGSGALRSIFAIHRQSPLFARLARDARLLDIARYILDDEVYVHQSRLNYKPGFDGKEFYWHSDFETWHVEDGMPRMRALSASLLLSENSPVNGPLMLIPGSHRTYVTCVGETPSDHYKQSLRKQEYGVPDRESLAKLTDLAGRIAVPTGPVGTVILFDCNTMHGSNGNITPFPRSNAFFVYNAISNALVAPFGAPVPRPDFIAARGDIAPEVAAKGSLAAAP
jgi:ectoine hydroxylase